MGAPQESWSLVPVMNITKTLYERLARSADISDARLNICESTRSGQAY